MAKSTKPKPEEIDAEEIVTVEVIVLPDSTKEKAIASLNPFRAALDEIKAKYEHIVITDKTSLGIAEEGKRKLTKIRTGIEKKRKELIAPALEYQRSLKEFTDSLTLEISPIEKSLSDKINAEQTRIEEERRKENIRRTNLIQESGYTLVGEFYRAGVYQVHFSDLDTCTEEELNMYIENGQKHLESERVRIAEQTRIEAELKEREAKIAAHENELAEFRAWKAAQAVSVPSEAPQSFAVTTHEVVTVQPEINFPAPNVPEPTQRFTTPEPVKIETQTPDDISKLTLKDVALINGISYSDLIQSLEVRVAHNTALKQFLVRFTVEVKSKREWIMLINQMLMK